MRGSTVVSFVALLGCSFPGASFAQSESDFVAAFSGSWQTLDPAFSDGGACRIQLGNQKVGGVYALQSLNCGGALDDLSAWTIVDNQLGLINSDSGIVARLGGNQTRMSGDTTAGPAVVFERLPENAEVAAISPATEAQSCVYYGYTATCASAEDLAKPAASNPDSPPKAEILVRLNARAEARPDAPIVATIPANTCVIVEECTTASDGNWCRTKISDYTGWIPQRAIRQNRWPIVTFSPGC